MKSVRWCRIIFVKSIAPGQNTKLWRMMQLKGKCTSIKKKPRFLQPKVRNNAELNKEKDYKATGMVPVLSRMSWIMN